MRNFLAELAVKNRSQKWLYLFMMKFVEFDISENGIWFWRNHDVILWIFPWKRIDGNKFISMSAHGYFKSLKEIDDYWEKLYSESSTKKFEEIDF